MQYKIISLILFLSIPVSSDSLKFNSVNNNGALGIINMPSARFYDQGSFALNFYKEEKDNYKKSILIAPLDGIEISMLNTTSDFYKPEFLLNQQKSFDEVNIKIRLKEEGDYPAIAIGINDINDEGLNSGEYIVASYGVDNLDFTIGMGWGNLDGLNSHKNFLGEIDENFLHRPEAFSESDEYKNYFRGDTLSVFSGISAVFLNSFIFKLEYDSSNFDNLILDEDYSRLNYGINFVGLEYIDIGISYEYGSSYGFHISIKKNLFK